MAQEASGEPLGPGGDPLALPLHERTVWLVHQLRHVEDLLMGVADVQKLLVGLLPEDQVMRDALRSALTEQAMTLPPGTARTLPMWSAIGLLAEDDADDGEGHG